jgi:outer membrane biosynthesis protein TonB
MEEGLREEPLQELIEGSFEKPIELSDELEFCKGELQEAIDAASESMDVIQEQTYEPEPPSQPQNLTEKQFKQQSEHQPKPQSEQQLKSQSDQQPKPQSEQQSKSQSEQQSKSQSEQQPKLQSEKQHKSQSEQQNRSQSEQRPRSLLDLRISRPRSPFPTRIQVKI